MVVRIKRQNVRRIYTEAMIRGDEATLQRVYAYLQGQGWSGLISVDEALDALGA